jgi:hypothetical protein
VVLSCVAVRQGGHREHVAFGDDLSATFAPVDKKILSCEFRMAIGQMRHAPWKLMEHKQSSA